MTSAIAMGAGADPTFEDATATHLVLPAGVSSDDDWEKDIAVADFDQNGAPDVFVVRKQPFSNAGPVTDLLFLNESGRLVGHQSLIAGLVATDSRDVQAADLNGDGWIDLIIANTFFQSPTLYWNRGNDPSTGDWLGFENASLTGAGASFPASGNVTVNLNPATGGTAAIKFCAVSAGDIDHDGDVDLFFANYNEPADQNLNVLLVNPGGIDPIFDDVSGQLGAMQGFQNTRRFGTGAEIVDMDQDTFVDIVMSEAGGNRLALNDVNSLGDFTNATPIPLPQDPMQTAYMMATGDLGGSNAPDQYLGTDFEDQVNITTSVSPYQMMSLPVGPASGGFAGNVHMADIDQDGDLDVGVANVDVDMANCPGGTAPLSPFLLLGNDGSGAMQPFTGSLPNAPPASLAVHDFAFLDVNQDSCLDLVMGLCSGWRVFLQSSAGCLDMDADGVLDTRDNCSEIPNIFQADADMDGYGDRCDGDLEQSGLTTISDFNIWKECQGKNAPAMSPPDCPAGPGPSSGCSQDVMCTESDFDGTGRITVGDFNILRNELFGRPPGPSGLACAQDPSNIVTPCPP